MTNHANDDARALLTLVEKNAGDISSASSCPGSMNKVMESRVGTARSARARP